MFSSWNIFVAKIYLIIFVQAGWHCNVSVVAVLMYCEVFLTLCSHNGNSCYINLWPQNYGKPFLQSFSFSLMLVWHQFASSVILFASMNVNHKLATFILENHKTRDERNVKRFNQKRGNYRTFSRSNINHEIFVDGSEVKLVLSTQSIIFQHNLFQVFSIWILLIYECKSF